MKEVERFVVFFFFFFFFKQKTAYEMCGRDWSSDVCSSDLESKNCQSFFTPHKNFILSFRAVTSPCDATLTVTIYHKYWSVESSLLCLDFSEKKEFLFLEEFPLKLLHNLYKHTGHNASRIIVVNFEYGKDYGGPGKDVFHTSRSVEESAEAHKSNFLHPVFYYYSQLPTGKSAQSPTTHASAPVMSQPCMFVK